MRNRLGISKPYFGWGISWYNFLLIAHSHINYQQYICFDDYVLMMCALKAVYHDVPPWNRNVGLLIPIPYRPVRAYGTAFHSLLFLGFTADKLKDIYISKPVSIVLQIYSMTLSMWVEVKYSLLSSWWVSCFCGIATFPSSVYRYRCCWKVEPGGANKTPIYALNPPLLVVSLSGYGKLCGTHYFTDYLTHIRTLTLTECTLQSHSVATPTGVYTPTTLRIS